MLLGKALFVSLGKALIAILPSYLPKNYLPQNYLPQNIFPRHISAMTLASANYETSSSRLDSTGNFFFKT